MKSTLLLLAFGVALATHVVASERSRMQSQVDPVELRCAYIGPSGSFTLVADAGTAAYRLGKDRFIADIEFVKEDKNWWIYTVRGNGDTETKGWAFARRPHCGKYSVLRYSNGTWRRFDRSEAWGSRLGESSGIRSTRTTEPSNQELLDTLRRIESRLDEIQPGGRPSLQDLERQLKDRL